MGPGSRVALRRLAGTTEKNASRLNNFLASKITYPHRLQRAYIPHVLLNEGAVMRRLDGGARRGARGRGMKRTPQPPGGDGAPPGDTMIPRQELADGGPHGAFET
jgi:hypothetical protein